MQAMWNCKIGQGVEASCNGNGRARYGGKMYGGKAGHGMQARCNGNGVVR